MSTSQSSLASLFVALFAVVFLAPAGAGAQQNDEPTPLELWEAFGHYVIVAQPERARSNWEALEGRVTDMELLEVVESSPEYDFERIREFVLGHDELRDIGRTIEQRLLNASLERSTDPEEIRNAIERLGEGRRPNMLATRFLVESGQLAVPHLLDALKDPGKRELRQFILRAMADIGRPAAYPLAVSLPHLDHNNQIHIAQVLGDIGYIGALPYLAAVLEDDEINDKVRRTTQAAFNLIARNVRMPERTGAAQLFLWQARRFYEAGTLGNRITGYERRADAGYVWEYRSGAGLISVEVPPAAHTDIRAMFAAMAALRHDPGLDPAVTRFLLANTRRELRLEGADDPSYPFPHPAGYYLRLAGAKQQLPVLRQALEDQDMALARTIIAALGDTGSPADLLARDEGVRPVLMAMGHPNRRIRIEMNLALARLHPKESFEGSKRVVPTLAQAIAQDGKRVAAVVTPEMEDGNEIAAMLDDRNYEVLRGTSVGELGSQLREVPGVDVLVTTGRLRYVSRVYDDTVRNYKLAATPVIAKVGASEWAELQQRYRDVPRLIHADARLDTEGLETAISDAEALDPEGPIDPDEATDYARRAIERLHEIGVSGNRVFDINDARPALIRALRDDRAEIARGAGRVLALIARDEAQRAIAEVALDSDTPTNVRVSLFNSLADSAARHGKRLESEQIEVLSDLVGDRDTTGDLAIAAARALGALQPPTERLRDIIAR